MAKKVLKPGAEVFVKIDGIFYSGKISKIKKEETEKGTEVSSVFIGKTMFEPDQIYDSKTAVIDELFNSMEDLVEMKKAEKPDEKEIK